LQELRRCERGLVLPADSFFESVAKVLITDASQLKKTHLELLNSLTPGEGYTTAPAGATEILHRQQEISGSKLSVMDVFCGTGGFSHGFEQTKAFEVVFGLDLLKDRASTFICNHPRSNVVVGDINKVSIETLEQLTPRPDIMIGGPPCQGFSSIRPFRNLTEKDPRNNLFESFALMVNYFKPAWFVLENVVGLLTHEGGKTLKVVKELFEHLGYQVHWKVLNAALYGLPQRRERLIIVGGRNNKEFVWPTPTYYFNGRSMAGKLYGQASLPLFEVTQSALTVMEAIHDLPEIKSGESAQHYRSDVEPTSYEKDMRGDNEHLILHESTKHSERMLEVIRHAGYNRNALPKGMTSSGFSSSYSRLEPDLPSVTLTVNFVHPASNKCIHPYQDRALTPREGARLQGFEDSYIFEGSRAQIVKQIGNAVPPLLGKVIAEAILEQF
jgi:DNA (cytosine-5)-methyltransferase 1